MRYVREHHNAAIYDYGTLYRWSIEYPEQFWTATLRHCGARLHREWQNVLEDGRSMPGARWFVGAELNFAENLLRFRDDRVALAFWGEGQEQVHVTYRELYDRVGRLVRALRAHDVEWIDQ